MNTRVAVLIASTLYLERMREATGVLRELGVPVTERGLSAHRTPDETAEFARRARENGFAAIVCGASRAAHVAGLVAAHTTLPVIGVPMSGGTLGGVDALCSTAAMPAGFPVATVGIDDARNAGLLAAQIVAHGDPAVRANLDRYRERMRRRGAEIDAQLVR
ncbi:5-(carboxyamino)imidazole ribonucleotide mutase [Saccharopolyspora rosea]|uniref:5-(carboxyamino)imidazole ribonucleotide mutase n=1 Tax=Saccharopolyspora rosea TaxID=524884 RepID=UPI0021D88B74|nr:AIR carboxylase family protein [Saccharopolyspora rosea]